MTALRLVEGSRRPRVRTRAEQDALLTRFHARCHAELCDLGADLDALRQFDDMVQQMRLQRWRGRLPPAE